MESNIDYLRMETKEKICKIIDDLEELSSIELVDSIMYKDNVSILRHGQSIGQLISAIGILRYISGYYNDKDINEDLFNTN